MVSSKSFLNSFSKILPLALFIFTPSFLGAQDQSQDDGLARSVPIDQADLDSVHRQQEQAQRQAEHETWLRVQQSYYTDFMQRTGSPLRWG
ncbi:MAG: hypothetical protein HY747_09470, partial [Elusimicrobia bacterium]|nr:hypothetical protein [Elusimicrobiota bacterium]